VALRVGGFRLARGRPGAFGGRTLTSWQFWLALSALFFAGLALVQWFSILHECGHETLFRTRALHLPLGHLAAFFSIKSLNS
jgi:fatty acid desaturase